MKIKKSTVLGLAAITAIGIAVYISRKQTRNHNDKIRLAQIADEGYEVANDILYPNKRTGAKNLRYGPVLPE